MRVWLLGPIDVVVGGEARVVHGLRRKAVLATLALHDGEIVSTGRLVDAVWGETTPPTALNTLQPHVSHLRGAERLDLLGRQIRRALSEARPAAGKHRQLVPELEQVAADYPVHWAHQVAADFPDGQIYVNGPAISVSTAQMIACSAALSWMRHGRHGEVLDLGRRRRRPTATLRRAAGNGTTRPARHGSQPSQPRRPASTATTMPHDWQCRFG